MEIAILHYAAPPVVGGVENVIGFHARLMAAAGERVRILAGRGGSQSGVARFIEIPLLDSRHPRVLEIKSALDQGIVPETFEELRLQIRSQLLKNLEGVDLLIAHNVGSLHKNLPLTAALMDIANSDGNPPLVLWHHDLAWTSERYRDELHDGFPWDILAQAWPGVRRHVVVSKLRQRELAELIDLPMSQIQVIPNGVDVRSFLKLGDRAWQIIQDLDLISAAPMLLLPVRITRRKNIELALNALANLRRQMPQARLLVTGPLGPHNPANIEYLRQLLRLRDDLGLKGAAHFLAEITSEFLPDEVIADFYRLTDGLFLTSRDEGFGIPLLEAGLAGIPIFCTDIPALSELAENQAEYFSPDEDPRTVAEKIALHYKSDPVYSMRRKARQSYSWEGIFTMKIAPLLEEYRERE
jgi:glycosyltransferase involved in cell wall biosynthesis